MLIPLTRIYEVISVYSKIVLLNPPLIFNRSFGITLINNGLLTYFPHGYLSFSDYIVIICYNSWTISICHV